MSKFMKFIRTIGLPTSSTRKGTWRWCCTMTAASTMIISLSYVFFERTSRLSKPRYSSRFALTLARRADVAVVVSYCNESEDAISHLESYVNDARVTGLVVEVMYYCKCAVREFCSFHLPNIGREGHTYLWHMSNGYDSNVTVFINGGFMSKSHAQAAVKKVFTELTDNSLQIKNNGLNFYCDEQKISWDDNPSLYARSNDCLSVQEYCSLKSNRCSISDLPCSGESVCGCAEQVNCSWIGATKENPIIIEGHLEPALNERGEKHSMFSWSCEKLGLSPSTIIQCGNSWSAVFAVGRSRLRRLPKHTRLQLLREFDNYSANGGIVVHYLERLWRSVFLC